MKNKHEEPQFWDDQRNSYLDYCTNELTDYRRFCAWFVGQETDQNGTRLNGKNGRMRGPLTNLLSLATRVARSNLYFRSPRFVVQTLPSLGANPNGPKIASIEAMLLNDSVDETDLYREGRRCILDGLLGPEMIMKVGYSADVGVDLELIEAERRHAEAEGLAMVGGGRPRMKDEDAHKVHMEAHQQLIAAAEDNSTPMDSKSLAYLKKHYKAHEDAMKKFGDRPLETVRFESEFSERVSPLRFFRDPMASRDAERAWVAESFLRRVDDVREDPEYDSGARSKVEASTGTQDINDDARHYPTRCPEDFCVLYEVIDLRKSKVLTYASGGVKALRVKDYKDQRIFPGGPYITASFIEDPITDTGVAMPRVYEGHQQYLSTWDEVCGKTLLRGVPTKVIKKGTFDADTLKKLQRNRVPDAWIVAADMDAGADINKAIQQLDPPNIPEFLFALRQLHVSGIERQTGGSAKLGGGDTSKTATASAIVQESGSDASEDLASVLDDFLSRVGRAKMRVMRRYYTPLKVAEIVGDEALQFWPIHHTERDIVRDKGVSVVAGSSRRKNIAVEQKLLTDLYVAVMANPTMTPEVSIELFRRVLDASGIHGIDLSGMAEMAQIRQMDEMMGGGGGGEEEQGAAPSEGKSARRGKARGTGAPSDQRGGLQNAGGGRVPTGAGKGDRPRMMR